MTVHVKEVQSLNKRVSAMLLSVTLALLALVVALLCSCSAPANTTQDTNTTDTDAPASDAATPNADDQVTSTAMVAGVQGDTVLLVDQDTQTPYYPTSSETVVYDIDGNVIALSDLVPGNVVTVVGDGIMLESYPGQYPGIATIEVTAVGAPEDADEYATLVAEVMPEPGNSVPSGAVEYTDDLGVVSVLLAPYAYNWQTDDGANDAEVSGSFFGDDGVLDAGIGDARIASSTDVTLSLEDTPQTVTIERVPLTNATDDVLAVNPTAQGEGVGIESLDDGAYRFTIDPGFVYLVKAAFANGNVEYAFASVER